MNKIEFIDKYITEHENRDNLYDSYPQDYKTLISNSKYVESLEMSIDYILQSYLGDMYEELMWYLYDRPDESEIEINGQVYEINDKEQFLSYLRSNYAY